MGKIEKAKLNVSKSKSGKLIVKAVFIDTNKEITVQNFKHEDAMALNGKEVDIERDNGLIAKISLDGETIYSKAAIPAAPKKQADRRPDDRHRQQSAQQVCTAQAPYNFIPLNDFPLEVEDPLSFDTYHENMYTGYLDLLIEAKTPLYIRDTLTVEQMKEKEEVERRGGKYNMPSDFCSTAGRPRIPGSSLRGMTQTMVEIVSFGKFGDFDDKRLYFRAVAGKSRLDIDYKETMVDMKNNHFPKIKAGILKKSGRKHRIYPSKTLKNTQIYRINFDKRKKVVEGPQNLIVPNFDFKEAYYMPVDPAEHQHTMPNGRNHNLRYAKLTSISTAQNDKYPQKGFIIASGEFGNKKHMHWVINEPDEQFVELDEAVIDDYKNDVNRNEKTDLLNKLPKHPKGIPCFYITDDKDKIISFGHTGMFRLAYKKTIGEHVPPSLKDKAKTDLAGAIFGNEKKFAGRVFFEDALCVKDKVEYEGEKIITLLGPKPTTFQHYLEQKGDNLADHPKRLAHYNSDNNIRGNKLYWHKSGNDWANKDQSTFNEKIDNKINPVKAGTTFAGRIRFENLSKVELGALLFALDLPKGCCHKLGMGKPLGLGSIKIIPKLFISDRVNRYTSLFVEWETPITEADKSEYMKEFESYVLKELKDEQQTLWSNERMMELKAILEFENRPSDDRTRYMTIAPKNEFKDRCVLPKPTETIKR